LHLVKLPLLALLTLTVAMAFANGMSALVEIDAEMQADLEAVFPDADEFRVRDGKLPHFRVYAIDSETGDETLLGFAYYTTDVEPLELGYKGPINFLVGLTVAGEVTSVRLIDQDEPYAYFSIETKSFQEQFDGKSILDRFRVGRDIDAISTATITISSAARSIRNGGRRIARQFLSESAE
jgi:NosR/NirI family nitrous oxide reductase transcriptional regulator